MKLTFKEKIAKYIIGVYSYSHLPEIALTALKEGYESESLLILAGMTDKDTTYERQMYFENGIEEIYYNYPNKKEAGFILLKFYLEQMVKKPDSAFELMQLIENEIFHPIFYKEKKQGKKKFVGQELGMEHMYTWYRELQDFEDGSALFYYNHLPKEKQRNKFLEHLVEEADKLLKKGLKEYD